MSGVFNVCGWLLLIIASIVMTGGTVVLGIILCRGRGNRNNQLQNQNLLIGNAEEVIGGNDINRQNQNPVLLIGNVSGSQNDLINESGLHGNIIRESNGNLNLERKNVVNQETIKQLVGIFAKIVDNWQKIANIVANLYNIDVRSVFVLDEAASKLQTISKHLTDANENLVAIKDFPASIINSKLVSDFLACLEKVIDDTDWVNDINENYRKYIEECFVSMGNRQGGRRRPNNNPQIRNVENLNRYVANLRQNNDNDGPENFEEMVRMLNSTKRTNTQHRDRINNIEERVNAIEVREQRTNENMQTIKNAMTELTNQLKLMGKMDKQHEENMKKLDQELEEIKRKNKEESDKRQKEIEEIKKQNKKELEEIKRKNKEESDKRQKEIEEMKQKTEEMKKANDERRKQADKEHAELFNQLFAKAKDLSNRVSSISSQNSSRNLSQEDNFGDVQETPGNEQNANFAFKNANDNININLNANQKEDEKNNGKKSLSDKINNAKNKEEDKKGPIPQQEKGKELDENKKEDEKK